MDFKLLNAQIQQLVQTNEGMDKVAQQSRKLISDRINEAGFFRKILPPTPAPQPLQVSTSGQDTLYAVVEFTSRATAMTVDFEGGGNSEVLRGAKAPVVFWSIETNRYTVNETKLMAYSTSIVQIVEEKIPMAIQAVEDRTGLIHVEAACQVVQLEANGGIPTPLNATSIAAGAVEDSITKGELARGVAVTGSSVPLPIQRADWVRGRRLFTNNKQLRAKTALITEFDLEGVIAWTMSELGSDMTGETLRQGLKAPDLFGVDLIMTLKTRILRPGNVYLFAPEDALGVFHILNDVKLFMDKRGRTIEFWAWEDIGMLIANIRGCAKLELYACDANPATDADALIADVTPMAEANLQFLNHRADAGIYYPQVPQF